MKKVFVSYSSKNQELIQAFLELLQLGMGIKKSDIFCTACPEMLPTGQSFIEEIRRRMQECETVISIITEEYLKSRFCLVEMGAAWAMSKHYFPLVMVPFENLNGTPLMGMQMRRMNSLDDLSVIYDELYQCGMLEGHQTAEFNKRASEFVSRVKKLMSDDFMIEKDEDGYYKAEIVEIRKNIPKRYRCYRIKGHIANPPDKESAKTDWLFYWENTFPDLACGDEVKFKTSKSKVNVYEDIGPARNIYTDDLKKPGK